MNKTSDLYLMHHGIKGMRWGVRRFEDANGHLTPAGKRRYAVQDARKYYKINRLQRVREKTDNNNLKKMLDGEIRRTQTRSDRKQALLSKKEIDIGREIVAKHRLNWAGANTAAKAALTAAGAYALYKNPNTRALAPLAIAGGAALTYGSAKKIPYYFMENRRYKQGNEKGSTKLGLSKKQQMLRKAGKIAAGATLAGVTGYALYKSGASDAAINAGRKVLESKTGINFEKNSGRDFEKNIDDAQVKNTNAESYTQPSSDRRTRSVRDTVSNLGATAKAKAKDAVRNKVMNDVDEDDPNTWFNAVKNAGDVIGGARRYGRAINNLRKGDKVGAVSEVSSDIDDATSKIIEGTQKRIDDIKNRHRKKRK